MWEAWSDTVGKFVTCGAWVRNGPSAVIEVRQGLVVRLNREGWPEILTEDGHEWVVGTERFAVVPDANLSRHTLQWVEQWRLEHPETCRTGPHEPVSWRQRPGLL